MTTCTAHCKFCGKKYEEKSKWIPGDILDLVIDIKHFFHAIRHHYKDEGDDFPRCHFEGWTAPCEYEDDYEEED